MNVVSMKCIQCGMRCPMEIQVDGDTFFSLSGNNCPRGEAGAVERLGRPRRIVRVHLRVENGVYENVPARSCRALPEVGIPALLRALSTCRAPAPLSRGDRISLGGVCFVVLAPVARRRDV